MSRDEYWPEFVKSSDQRREVLDHQPHEAFRDSYQQCMERKREELMLRVRQRDRTPIDLPGTQQRVQALDLDYRQILDCSHAHAERITQRAINSTRQSEARIRYRAGEGH